MKKCGIYLIKNLINNKIYIGQSIDIERRIKDHFTRKDDAPLHCAIQKYGKENFETIILEECSREQLNEKEIYYIKEYNSFGKNGYNLNNGGNTCPNDFTLTRKEKISLKSKGRICPMKGKHHSEETKQKLREMNLGKKPWNYGLTKDKDKRILNISNKLKGNKNSKDRHFIMTKEQKEKLRLINLGKHHSEETKTKMSEAQKRRYNNGN